MTAVAQDLNANKVGDFLDHLVVSMPPLASWENDAHEIQLAFRMMGSWSRGDDTRTILQLAVSVLALLACRDVPSQTPYGGVAISPEALADYPINLASFRVRVEAWKLMSFSAFTADLVTWCLNTHLRVALRKLRYTGRSTFHLRPSERGLEVVGEIPPPANTTPRFRQAVQILRDVGALTRDSSKSNRQTRLSDTGAAIAGWPGALAAALCTSLSPTR